MSEAAYQSGYYQNSNPDLLARIPLTGRDVLEIGCGAAGMARAYLARNPSAAYTGVELFETVARQAAEHLSDVLVGDIEQPSTMDALDRVRGDRLFDVLVCGDVLEHLHDPWRVLSQLRSRMAPGAVCVVCIPNVGHWSVLQQQLKGRWDYADAGLLDRTHLRFFTLETAVEMLQQAGWSMVDAKPRVLWPAETETAVSALAVVAQTMGLDPQKLRRDLSAFQWIIRAVNAPVEPPLSVAAIGLKRIAGVTEARVDHPLTALATSPTVSAVWGVGTVTVPPDRPPGVLILQRAFMNDAPTNERIEQLIAKGWLLVIDIDDDPRHWREYIENDFYAFRAAHAVTVSTGPLADMIRHWNPNVAVFPNAILELPQVAPGTPKQGERVRVFFGALNRGADWAAIWEGLLGAAAALGDTVEFVVVHDREFFQALPDSVSKTFQPTLAYPQYMDLLASCDVALLPLADTAFNRLKSDLKLIECCAAGVVAVCSPVVYAQQAVHRDIAVFAETALEWRQALVRLCTDSAEVAQRRALGLSYVKAQRMHCHQIAARESFYRGLVAQREALELQRRQRI